MKIITFTGLVASMLLAASVSADPASPYAGQERFRIKTRGHKQCAHPTELEGLP
jgi:hypothetical protein